MDKANAVLIALNPRGEAKEFLCIFLRCEWGGYDYYHGSFRGGAYLLAIGKDGVDARGYWRAKSIRYIDRKEYLERVERMSR